MLYPNLSIDNFFTHPEKIIEFANNCKFNANDDGRWPGYRTDQLHEIDVDFFNFITQQIVTCLYPVDFKKMAWKASSTFQKIPGHIYKNVGWIHNDSPSEFTSIIYLSHHKKCGTSLYMHKSFDRLSRNEDSKREGYLKQDPVLINKKKPVKENNANYEKTFSFQSRFNRMILFDANHPHGADKFYEEDCQEDRLTLITFFHSLFNRSGEPMKYPSVELKRNEL